jgi:hypothetical protein
MRKLLSMLLVVCILSLARPAPAQAAAATQVSADVALISFPETITFKAHLQADEKITSVVLEYGDEQLTCGNVIAKAFPQFTSSDQMDVEWTWEMRQSGGLPPGASVWWRWHVTTASGAETVSDKQTITWLDAVHKWQVVSAPNLNVHWYDGSQRFANQMLEAAKAGLAGNETRAGLKPAGSIDVYIYSTQEDLKAAILYAPSWIGGGVTLGFNLLSIIVGPGDLATGQRSVTHELTHVLVNQVTFSCLTSVPLWLHEGLAVNSEGPLEKFISDELDKGISTNTLLPLRALSGKFTEITDKAYLSYGESYSVVKFLVDTYGQPKMTALLTGLGGGATIDEALQSVYGFNVEGLEDAWRAAIGAQPRAVSANATATLAPTPVPTIVPASGAPPAVTPTPFSVPTSSTAPEIPTAAAGSSGSIPSNSAILIALVLLCCCLLAFLLIIIVVVVRVLANRKGGANA